ncbi:DeoR/GlpR transcriptional regulator [Mycolicibacterium vaccae]|nr:DeoR/GlpR transcriptional regulator [Mycolicibacterium vaccae]
MILEPVPSACGKEDYMLAATRRERIVELVSARRSISSDELAEALGVSVETVRRDLRTLDETRQLQRVRGGAIHAEVRTSNKEPSFTDRTILAADAKNAIGESAAQLLLGANTVFVDIGTTAIAVARAMLGSFTGTVITPSMWVAEVLSSGSDIDVFMPGGKVRGATCRSQVPPHGRSCATSILTSPSSAPAASTSAPASPTSNFRKSTSNELCYRTVSAATHWRIRASS